MATETEPSDWRERLKHSWEIASSFAINGVLGLAALLSVVVITNLFYEALLKRSIVIEPILVPKDMEANGYTPDVAALHLIDTMNKYVVHARTGDAGPKLVLHKDVADFVLPNVGFSFKAVVAQIRTFIPIGRSQNISGEIMRVGEQLRLRLRKNDVFIPEVVNGESPEGADPKDLKTLKALFDDAALRVFAATLPYYEAVAKSENNPEVALELAKKFIAERPSDWPWEQNVMWSHNLLGSLLYQNGKLDDRKCKVDDQECDRQKCKLDDQECERQKCKLDDQNDKLDEHAGDEDTDSAIREFKWVIHHPGFRDRDRRLAIAHLNLGLAYIEQGHVHCAKLRFDEAIRIDPQLGIAYLKLGDLLGGDVFDQTRKAEKAPCAYLEAIAKFHQDVVSDPSSAVAHQRLGNALNNKDKAPNNKGEADRCASHKERVLKDLDMLKDLRAYDSVIAEYQRAAELDPDDAHVHYDLGLELLKRPDQVDKSIEELQRALDIRDVPNDSFDEFKDDLLKRLSELRHIKAMNYEKIHDRVKAKSEHRVKAKSERQKADELFDRAVSENEALIDDKPNENPAAYKRQGVNHYLIGDFEKAVKSHNTALDVDDTYLAVKIDRGYAWFAVANEHAAVDFDRAAHYFDNAAKDFDDALHLPRGQANTMMWLYLATERSGQRGQDHPNLSKKLQSTASELRKANRWPLPIIQLFSGVRFPDEVLTSAGNAAEQCQAHFHVGEWFVLNNKPPDARKSLQKAEEICQFYSVERPAATAELKRLGPIEGVAAMGASPGISTNPRRSRR
jgi:tetratricopeptide (TPR) repeat protein